MAERRMFAKSIIESDLFLDMPISARLLYYDLGMRGDDDGFVNSPKRIMRTTGAHDDDLKILIAKQFVIIFESGVIVIRHWKTHNYIRADRYKPTQYQNEKATLIESANGHYELAMAADRLPVGIPNDHQLTDNREHRLGKVSIGEVREIENNKTICEELADESAPPRRKQKPHQGASQDLENAVITLTLNDKSEFGIIQAEIDVWAELYPAVDIMQELRKMKGWLDANPKQRKTRAGIKRFVNSWLARTQDKGGSIAMPRGGATYGANRSNNAKSGYDATTMQGFKNALDRYDDDGNEIV